MGEIDEMTAVWDDLIRLNPGKWDHVVVSAVDLMDGAVDPRRIPPTQNHGCLPANKVDRHVLAHRQDALTMLRTDPLRLRHQLGCGSGQMSDHGVGQQLGEPEERPVPPGNRGLTPATADQDHVSAVASGRHLAGQHPAERFPTQDAGRVAEIQFPHHPIGVGGQVFAVCGERQPGRLELQAMAPLRREQAFVAGHSGEQNEPLPHHRGH